MKKVIGCLSSLLVLGVGLCQPATASAVARVDGKPIEKADVEYLTQKVLKLPKDREKSGLQQAINNRVLYNRAKKEHPALVAEVERVVQLLMARDYFEPYRRQIAAPKADKAVTEAMVKEKVGKQEDMVHLHQITFADRKTADEVLPQLRSGELAFDEAARRYSKGITGERGGDVGGIYRSSTMYPKETLDLLFRAQINVATEVVQTQLGPAVFLISERIEAAQWEKMTAKQIRKDLVTAKVAEAVWKDVEAFGEKKAVKLLITAENVEAASADRSRAAIDFKGKKFTVEDVLARSGGADVHGTKDLLSIAENAWRDLVLQELYVKAKGKLPDHAMKERVLLQNFTARKLLNKITADLKVEESEILAHMASHPKEFELPDRVDLGVIFVRTEQRLKEVRKLLAEGKPFEDVAKAYSQDENSAKVSGKVGWVPVQSAAGARPEPGAVSEPLEVKGGDRPGWFLFKTYAVSPAHALKRDELDDVALGTIRAKIIAEKREKVIVPYLVEARKAAKVEIL